MQIHQLKAKHKNKSKKRVGRGGKRGTYSGKGQKGQKSRAGKTTYPIIRELIKKYPKLKGYRSDLKDKKIAVVNVGKLDGAFENSQTVNPKTLIEKGLVSKIKGRVPKVKILGKGTLSKKLIIEDCEISKSAKEAVEKAGGSIGSIK